MPPKAKKKEVVVEPVFPIPRVLACAAPIDAIDGALGIEHPAVGARISAVKTDLLLWRISETVSTGALDLDVSDHSLSALPEELMEIPWVQVLNASRNRLSVGVFEQLRRLPTLRAVDLTTNLLVGALPEGALAALPASTLEELVLDENVLEALPASLALLHELKWLSARQNLLKALPGGALAGLARLRHLDLRHNKLAALPEEIGACAASLVELRLDHNALASLPASLGACARLELLTLSHNALAALPESLAGCRSLVEVDVSFNALDALPPAICASPKLERLFAPANKIATLPPEVGALVALRVLNLAGNLIETLPDEVGRWAFLREIYMNNNPIAALPESVGEWKFLKEAAFKNCKLKALPLSVATGWAVVSFIDVRGKKKDTCKVTQEFVDSPSFTAAKVAGVILPKPKKKAAEKGKGDKK